MDELGQNTTSMPSDQSPKKSLGPAIGLIIILLIIIIGSLYFFKNATRSVNTEQPVSDVETDVANLQEQGASDEISDIERDLKATDLSNLDSELESAQEEIDNI